VDTGNGNMERILGRLRWQRLPADEGRRKCNSRICDVQKREAFEHGAASLRCVWITRTCFGQHDLRGEEIVVGPLLLPPCHGELLMGRYKQVPARPCREIIDDARFDIDSGSGDARVWSVHGLKLLEKSGCVWIMITDFRLSVCTRL
jgi:hypothetical protein